MSHTRLHLSVGCSRMPFVTAATSRRHATRLAPIKAAEKDNKPTIVIEDADSSVAELLARDRKAQRDLDLVTAETEFDDPRLFGGNTGATVESVTSSTMGDGSDSVEDVMRGYEQRSSAASSSAMSSAASSTRDGGSGSGVLKSKTQRRRDIAKLTDEGRLAAKDPARPKKCGEAIDAGLVLFQKQDYAKAIELFNLALELPGNGAYRVSGTPREYSCPSEAEENAALYNMACAYAQLRQNTSALTCLEAVLENGYQDFKGIRTDPDLAPLRGNSFDALLSKYDGVGAKLKRLLGGSEKKNESRPWILW